MLKAGEATYGNRFKFAKRKSERKYQNTDKRTTLDEGCFGFATSLLVLPLNSLTGSVDDRSRQECVDLTRCQDFFL
ncbi:unnamed protein product [Ceratitis capitata]|uniref:(Mediterranean fruit fly) hypothetical protein n=1 Tax=Ceratitis capitata TaxID=7213 RepID=A0A811VBB7_CERCA|nr:unnamed protein product [Ceratitis capitata]